MPPSIAIVHCLADGSERNRRGNVTSPESCVVPCTGREIWFSLRRRAASTSKAAFGLLMVVQRILNVASFGVTFCLPSVISICIRSFGPHFVRKSYSDKRVIYKTFLKEDNTDGGYKLIWRKRIVKTCTIVCNVQIVVEIFKDEIIRRRDYVMTFVSIIVLRFFFS